MLYYLNTDLLIADFNPILTKGEVMKKRIEIKPGEYRATFKEEADKINKTYTSLPNLGIEEGNEKFLAEVSRKLAEATAK